MTDVFSGYKDAQSAMQWDRDRNMDTIIEISLVYGQPLLLYYENKY